MHNISKYYGNNKPLWCPSIRENTVCEIHKLNNYHIFEIHKLFNNNECRSLIDQFNRQEMYPVGVDGYCNPNEKIGSYRTMGWSESIANEITYRIKNYFNIEKISNYFPDYKYKVDDDLINFEFPFKANSLYYKLLGSTPWLRFMKYKSGGKHVPHYDCPFINEEESYITLFSWVLYLNSPNGSGGNFQFVNDGQFHLHPIEWNRSDHTEMSNNIILDIKAEEGKLLIFPHWLCHQVEYFYAPDDYRYIIRGDLAYGK